jgi:hypothetical protein
MGLLRRVVDVIAVVVADMVDRGPSYDVEQRQFHFTQAWKHSSRVRVHNVSSSQGDVDSFHPRILAHRMGSPLSSAART